MPKDMDAPNRSVAPNDQGIEAVVDSYGRFHAWLTRAHVPDFLELNLTLAQLRALYLVTASGPMSMSHVAERLGTAPSTATGVVDALVQLGLLERTEDPSDRRQVVVGPTPAAHERLEDFSELSRRRLRELLSHIQSTDDLVIIERAIDLLTDAAGRAERTPNQ
jgi:DNA-binding MarR family transcriptional regulator